MGIKERQERERQERREMILKAANEIVSKEGVDQLSIRKIAKEIEYSPSLIYHYFENKEAILEEILTSGYQNILASLRQNIDLPTDPLDRFETIMKNYIHHVMKHPEEYKVFMLNETENVVKHTAVLGKGVSTYRPTVAMLCKNIRPLVTCSDDEVELLAQNLWSATFGLLIRMIIEKISTDQQERLIDFHLKLMVSAIKSF